MRDPRDRKAEFEASGWWGNLSIADYINRNVERSAHAPAFIAGDEVLSWAEYSNYSSIFASSLIASGIATDQKVAVMLPDGPSVHSAFVGTEKAGVVAVGIGPRAGDAEIEYLLRKTGAVNFATHATVNGRSAEEVLEALRARGVNIERHICVPDRSDSTENIKVNGKVAIDRGEILRDDIAQRRLGPNDLWLLNSTSGTTGMPKCVTQYMQRWMAYHKMVEQLAEVGPNDVMMSVVPAQFGFGLWTSHFTPTMLGIPCVVLPKFTPSAMITALEQHNVSLLAAVTTQFILMLNDPEVAAHDFSSLRVMWTGGETVPYARAAEFEERTGAFVLQFFGSNETGAVSATSIHDTRELRLSTCGKPIPVMETRLFHPDSGEDITGTGHPGVPGVRGPVTCAGYYDDDAANDELYTPDGWMLMGDIVSIGDDGYLRVEGRKSDFIIRGGKNISARVVEEQVATHPTVALSAAVAVPDDVFGQRVGVYVVFHNGRSATEVELLEHLDAQGYSKEYFPEYFIIVDSLPMASGGKVAKGTLKEDVLKRHGEGSLHRVSAK
ncbi:MAG: acyl--CoA ligase [Actinobacteria bacterium]|nr:acyl--CoA ligase [Actinomycetota bacterium]